MASGSRAVGGWGVRNLSIPIDRSNPEEWGFIGAGELPGGYFSSREAAEGWLQDTTVEEYEKQCEAWGAVRKLVDEAAGE
jgi:hypothetical protein